MVGDSMAGIIQFNSGIIGAITLGVGDYLDNTATGVITTAVNSAAAVLGVGGAASVTNAGFISGSGKYGFGVRLTAGGTITNSGIIGASGQSGDAIRLDSGGNVYNAVSGTIDGSGRYGHGLMAYSG